MSQYPSESKPKREIKKQMEIIEKEVLSVKYGTVSIMIQDGVIVQIEKNEKFRMK